MEITKNHDRYTDAEVTAIVNAILEGSVFVGDLELIIIDDYSIDKSREIIKKYKEKDNRITTIFHEENKGIAKSTNDGVNISKGKFLAFIDSDDVWERDKLEKQLRILEKDENLIVWSDGMLIDENGESLGKTFIQLCNASNRKKSGYIFFELLIGNFINKSSLIFKKKSLGNISFNERFK
ncbi:hypothetical protein LCGC14_2719820, partial [marine sediment metagenome]